MSDPDPDPDPFAADGPALTDEEWDRLGDTELDAMAESTSVVPGPRAPWEPSIRFPPPPRVYDRRLAALTSGGVGEFVRACRASAGLSQRQLADTAGIPQSTVARIESGRNGDPRLSTVVRLAEECEVMLVGTTASYAPGSAVPLLESDHAQRHRDGGDRLLPAHLVNGPRPRPEEVSFPEHTNRPYTRRRYGMSRIRDIPDD